MTSIEYDVKLIFFLLVLYVRFKGRGVFGCEFSLSDRDAARFLLVELEGAPGVSKIGESGVWG